MEADPKALAGMRLFAGIPPEEIPGLLEGLGARQVRYRPGDLLIEEGSHVRDFGVVLSGRARSVKWDPAGQLVILTLLEAGSELGILLAARPERESPVSVQATEAVSALWVPCAHLLAPCERAGRGRLLRNYLSIAAEKGLVLHERMDCLLRPTVREKVLAYLAREGRGRRGLPFQVPLDRNAMAEYLNVERSALSRELSRMRRDGLIDYHRSTFRLL